MLIHAFAKKPLLLTTSTKSESTDTGRVYSFPIDSWTGSQEQLANKRFAPKKTKQSKRLSFIRKKEKEKQRCVRRRKERSFPASQVSKWKMQMNYIQINFWMLTWFSGYENLYCFFVRLSCSSFSLANLPWMVKLVSSSWLAVQLGNVFILIIQSLNTYSGIPFFASLEETKIV